MLRAHLVECMSTIALRLKQRTEANKKKHRDTNSIEKDKMKIRPCSHIERRSLYSYPKIESTKSWWQCIPMEYTERNWNILMALVQRWFRVSHAHQTTWKHTTCSAAAALACSSPCVLFFMCFFISFVSIAFRFNIMRFYAYIFCSFLFLMPPHTTHRPE